MISLFKTLCCSVLFFFSFGYAQFNKNNTELIRCSYTKSYDKSIILPYLRSSNLVDVNAALLTIANSRDTAFIDELLQINNKKVYPYFFFCLSKMGESKKITSFLFQSLHNLNNAELERLCVATIGCTGDSSDLDRLVTGALLNDRTIEKGISLAVYNFYQRHITHNKTPKVFLNLLRHKNYDVLFSIYRTSADSAYLPFIENIFNSTNVKRRPKSDIQYALGIFRKLKSVPRSESFLQSIAGLKDSDLGSELARLLCSAKQIDSSNLQLVFKLLHSSNPQVQIQTALSLRNVTVTPADSVLIKHAMIKYAIDIPPGIDATNLLFELCLTYHKLFPGDTSQILKFSENLEMKQLYRLYGEIAELFYGKSASLMNSLSTSPLKKQYYIIQSLMKLRNYKADSSIDSFIVSSLKKNSIPVWSAFIENIDSSFYQRNSSQIKIEILRLANSSNSNSQYSDIFSSLFEVISGIDKEFLSEYKSALHNTNIFSIQNLLLNKKAKDTSFLDTLFRYMWKHHTVKVITQNGSFIVELKPGIAPISVANFLYLQSQNFFDGISFHRVVPGFVIQTGDPTGTGSGGSEHEIITEISPEHFNEGAVGMARSSYDSESSQWFVCTGSYPHLDGNYTNFGRVSKNLDIAHRIEQDDVILHIELVK